MSQKHLLYFTANRVVLYRWSHARLAVESSFANNEEGAEAFADHLHSVPKELFYVLVDIVEEDFHQENVPFVRGRDRQILLGRKLAQRYRDTSLSLALSLGYERTQRRDERVLFSAFTNNAQFQPWLEALLEHELPVAGVFSVALMAPQLAAKVGPKKAPLLLVTLQSGGLRQSYVENSRIRFSRLGPLDPADAADLNRVAEAFDRETTRVYQYLTAMRVLAREGGAIDAVLVAPNGEKRRVQAACPNLPQVRVNVIELGEAATAVGLKAYPEGSGAEVLFLHLLALGAPREQYGGEALRQYFQLRQVRTALVAGGALLGAAGLIWGGVQLVQYFGLQDQINVDRQRARVANDGYGKVTAAFPALPTTTDNLRVTMQKYAQLVKQTAPPERLVADISRALEAAPRIEVEKIRWEITATNPKDKIREAERRVPGAPGPVGQAPRPGTAAKGELFEVAELDALVVGAKASDYKAVNGLINAFVEQLAKRPGLEVVQTKMPFDLGSQDRLAGEVGAATTTAVPKFTVLVTKKVGS
jgi:hypothetical protein